MNIHTANTNVAAIQSAGKEELRAKCRQLGISYGKLNNAGMRDAILAHPATEQEEPVAQTNFANMFDQSVALAKATTAPASGTVVVDGKRSEPRAAPAPRQPVQPRTPAPDVPRVSRKGYTIQKEREERNGVKRPSEGTVCGAVWAEFDKNPATKASDLAAIADANGWNRTNVACEFYAWRKFMGIRGRQSK